MSSPKKSSETCDKLAKYRQQDKEQQAEDGAGVSSDTKQAAAATNKVLDAIALCQSTLTTKIKKVKIDVSQNLSTLRDHVAETETRINRAEDILHPLQHTTDDVRRQLQQITMKQDDMENRLRRCNLRFIGLPESVEGTDFAVLLENLLTSTFGRDAFSMMFAVERAHHIPAHPPPPGAPPCTLIAKFLNFKDRDKILRLTREKGNIPYTNTHVAVFPDFTNEVQRLIATFWSHAVSTAPSIPVSLCLPGIHLLLHSWLGPLWVPRLRLLSVGGELWSFFPLL